MCVRNVEQNPVGEVGEKNTDDNRQLVEGDQAAAQPRRGEFCNIHRHENRSHTDANTTDDPGRDENGKRRRNHGQEGRYKIKNCGHDHRRLAPEPVSERAGEGSTSNTSDQRSTSEPSHIQLREAELALNEPERTRDDSRVEAEQETAEGGKES